MDQILKKSLEKIGIEITDRQKEQFDAYHKLLEEWNKVMNLTGITESESVPFIKTGGLADVVGGKRFFVLNKTENPTVGTIFDAFRSGHYVNVVLVMFLKNLFTSLWTLLFVIPGIVKHYEYLMIPYILAENPGMDRKEAFQISKRMMDGQKMETFILDLSFIGWILLSAITCGYRA